MSRRHPILACLKTEIYQVRLRDKCHPEMVLCCKHILNSETRTRTCYFLVSAGRCMATIGGVFGIYMIIILIGWLVEMTGLMPEPKSCSRLLELGSDFWAACPFLGMLVILVILACIIVFAAIVISIFICFESTKRREEAESRDEPTPPPLTDVLYN